MPSLYVVAPKKADDFFEAVVGGDSTDPRRHLVVRDLDTQWIQLHLGFEIAVVGCVFLLAVGAGSLGIAAASRNGGFRIFLVAIEQGVEIVFAQCLIIIT